METTPKMTLRDYFAAIALQGIIASDDGYISVKDEVKAERAYSYADAMLKVRAKEH